MSKMEAQLLAMDKTDQADNNGRYLKSRSLDVDREEIPQWWDGQSRCQLLEKLEKLALEYGEYFQLQIWTMWPRILAKSCQGSFHYYCSIIAARAFHTDATSPNSRELREIFMCC